MARDAAEIVRAAGGVVWRRTEEGADEGAEVLVVHRPKYDDWSLPKGKLDNGERHDAAALREVEEETGYRCALGGELPSTAYHDRDGRPKTVRYWAMTVRSGTFTPNREVDEVRWVSLEDATALLTYDRDRTILSALPNEL